MLETAFVKALNRNWRLLAWRFLAITSILVFLYCLIQRNSYDLSLWLPILLMTGSLMILRSFILKTKMFLGGFDLDVDQILFRLFFVAFAVLIWLVSIYSVTKL